MAESLVESLASDFEPEQYEDDYKIAMGRLIDAKLEGEDAHELLAPETDEGAEEADVVDLVAALRKSVETAQGKVQGKGKKSAGKKTAGSKKAGTKKTASKKQKKAPAKKPAAKKPAAKKVASRRPAAKRAAAKKSA